MKKLVFLLIFYPLSLTADTSTTSISNICESIAFSMSQFSSWRAVSHEDYTRIKPAGEEFVPMGIDGGKENVPKSFKIFVSKYSTDFVFLCRGEKLRVEKHIVSYQKTFRSVFHNVYVFDGERTYSYKIAQDTENLIAKPQAAVFPGYGIGDRGNPVALSFAVLCYSWDGEVSCCYPLEKLLSGKTRAGKVNAVGNEEVDGLNCNVFISEEVDGVTYKVWIAPERMFCLKKAEITTPTEMIVVNNTYEQNGNLWILKERVEESFNRLNMEKLQENRMTIKEFTPFINIADNEFVMEFPSGIEVHRFDQ